MKCNNCGHEFEPFEYFVVQNKVKENDKDTFMCENCFFELALSKLNYESVKMDHKGISYYSSDLEAGFVDNVTENDIKYEFYDEVRL